MYPLSYEMIEIDLPHFFQKGKSICWIPTICQDLCYMLSYVSYLIFTKSYRVDIVHIFTDKEGEAGRL